MRPAEWFLTALHDVDPALDCIFNVQRQRWVVVRDVAGTQTHVRTIETPEGQYQPLCDEVIEWLKRRDMWEKSLEQLARAMDDEEERQRAGIKDSIKSTFHDAAMDDKLQIKRAINFGDTSFPSATAKADTSGDKDK